MAPDAVSRANHEKDYLNRIRTEIRRLNDYTPAQMRRHRLSRILVIICAASVPVLASWSSVPRVLLGALGALAASIEGIAQLMQFQSRAAQAMGTQNSLERELNLFLFEAGPYSGNRSFSRFVEHIEEIRASADQAFFDILRKEQLTAGDKSSGQ